MAEKIIKTKVALRQNTYSYWTDNSVTEPATKPAAGSGTGKYYVPLNGEVCFCEITTTNGNNATTTTPPTVLFKVGNGKDYFKDLNWASALAADVYDWAKKSLDEFTAWVAKTPKTVTLTVNDVLTDYSIEDAIKLVRSEIAAGGTAATITIADESEDGKVKYVAKQGGVDIVEAIEINEGTGIDISVVEDVPVISHQAKPTTGNAVTPTTDTTTGNTFITAVTIDNLGHVAGVKSKTVTIPDSPSISIVDKKDAEADTENFVYAVTNLVESGTLNHTITPTYTAVPTQKYVDDEIAAKVASAVQYLGTVSAAENLGKDSNGNTITIGRGDIYRASAAFDLGSEKVHVGDMLIAVVDDPGATVEKWTVAHLEIDTDTWTENSDSAAGYVAATGGTTNAGKVWKVGADGKPAWLADTDTDTHYQAKLVFSTSSEGKENVANNFNGIYLNLIENDEARSATYIQGTGGTKVSSILQNTPNGILPTIQIDSVDTWRAIGFGRKTAEGNVGPYDIAASSQMLFKADSGLAWKVEEQNNVAIATIGLDDTITFILDCN